MIRSTYVAVSGPQLKGELADDLDQLLSNLQKSGCKIISITPHTIEEYNNNRKIYVDKLEFIIIYDDHIKANPYSKVI